MASWNTFDKSGNPGNQNDFLISGVSNNIDIPSTSGAPNVFTVSDTFNISGVSIQEVITSMERLSASEEKHNSKTLRTFDGCRPKQRYSKSPFDEHKYSVSSSSEDSLIWPSEKNIQKHNVHNAVLESLVKDGILCSMTIQESRSAPKTNRIENIPIHIQVDADVIDYDGVLVPNTEKVERMMTEVNHALRFVFPSFKLNTNGEEIQQAHMDLKYCIDYEVPCNSNPTLIHGEQLDSVTCPGQSNDGILKNFKSDLELVKTSEDSKSIGTWVEYDEDYDSETAYIITSKDNDADDYYWDQNPYPDYEIYFDYMHYDSSSHNMHYLEEENARIDLKYFNEWDLVSGVKHIKTPKVHLSVGYNPTLNELKQVFDLKGSINPDVTKITVDKIEPLTVQFPQNISNSSQVKFVYDDYWCPERLCILLKQLLWLKNRPTRIHRPIFFTKEQALSILNDIWEKDFKERQKNPDNPERAEVTSEECEDMLDALVLLICIRDPFVISDKILNLYKYVPFMTSMIPGLKREIFQSIHFQRKKVLVHLDKHYIPKIYEETILRKICNPYKVAKIVWGASKSLTDMENAINNCHY